MKLPCEENMNRENDRTFTVWKICDRIRQSQSLHKHSELRKSLQEHDPCSCGFIQGYEFANVLGCVLRECICGAEICQLADYFQTPDSAGVAYTQFLDVIRSDEESLGVLKTRKSLSSSEHRLLSLLLMQIAKALQFREQVLRPYFEDYDLIARNGGSVTYAYFKRVLYFLGITFGLHEWDLLAKRYMVDNYKIDYESFVKEIDQLLRYLDSKGPLDRRSVNNVPSKIITATLPKSDRPEVGVVNLSEILGKHLAYHPCLTPSKEERDFQTIMDRIQRFIWENRVRTREFFEQFDLLVCGWISRSQFVRSMDALGLSGLYRLPLTDREIRSICERYQDPKDANKICWISFAEHVDEVFTLKNLDHGPFQVVESPPDRIKNLPQDGASEPVQQKQQYRDLTQEIVGCIRTLVEAKRVLIAPVFKDFDPHRNGHITRSQVGEALSMAGVMITEEQRYALSERYSDDLGFNYVKFLNDVDPMPVIRSAYEDLQTRLAVLNAADNRTAPDPHQCDIVRVLAKVKGQVVRRKLRIIDPMRGFDPLNHFRITKEQFERGLSTASFDLTPTEVHTLAMIFKTPLQNTIDYKRFGDTVAEVDYQCDLEKAPMLVPLQHVSTEDGPHNHLNFEERTIASRSLQKLARYADVVSNLRSLFQDFDRNRIGVINRNQLIRALAVRDLHTAISSREFEVLCKCFGVEIGYRQEINYRALLTALDYLYANRENHPF
ncbi:uncharacterized protein LOC131676318 [Topomyia yanbarensis]|uniref:uncharacterized protein LOC131676318 n=1 Tax=Topomyia yanbarensis TaxID=2498891 RepID=UPI00273C9B54|nr:uncharacterized protein LOC131676318 [Topomyia yanbarensis]